MGIVNFVFSVLLYGLSVPLKALADALPHIVWGMIKMAVAFSVVLILVDQINEVTIDLPAMPESWVWLWFYFRLDLLLTFLGSVYAVGLVTKFVSRA